MEGTSVRRPNLNNILVTACAVSAVLAVGLFGYLKSAESKFKKEKSALIKSAVELKDELDSVKETIKTKTDAINTLEADKKALAEEIASLKKEVEHLSSVNMEEIEALRKENKSLREASAGAGAVPKDSTTMQMIEAVAAETQGNIRKVLEEAMQKIDMINSGKLVTLEPIVVTEGTGPVQGKGVRILSVDPKNNLLVIEAGTVNNVREGQRCSVLKDGKEIGSAEIIKARYKISAAFVDDIKHKHSMKDIKEGDRVLMQ